MASGVPKPKDLLSTAANSDSLSSYLARTGGGIGLAAVYLIVNPVQSLSVGLGTIVTDLSNAAADFLSAPLDSAAALINAGTLASSGALLNEGLLGFILSIALVIGGYFTFQTGLDLIGVDIPGLGLRLPFVGPDDDDDEV